VQVDISPALSRSVVKYSQYTAKVSICHNCVVFPVLCEAAPHLQSDIALQGCKDAGTQILPAWNAGRNIHFQQTDKRWGIFFRGGYLIHRLIDRYCETELKRISRRNMQFKTFTVCSGNSFFKMT
jgi:hypothetical protein